MCCAIPVVGSACGVACGYNSRMNIDGERSRCNHGFVIMMNAKIPYICKSFLGLLTEVQCGRASEHMLIKSTHNRRVAIGIKKARRQLCMCWNKCFANLR